MLRPQLRLCRMAWVRGELGESNKATNIYEIGHNNMKITNICSLPDVKCLILLCCVSVQSVGSADSPYHNETGSTAAELLTVEITDSGCLGVKDTLHFAMKIAAGMVRQSRALMKPAWL